MCRERKYSDRDARGALRLFVHRCPDGGSLLLAQRILMAGSRAVSELCRHTVVQFIGRTRASRSRITRVGLRTVSEPCQHIIVQCREWIRVSRSHIYNGVCSTLLGVRERVAVTWLSVVSIYKLPWITCTYWSMTNSVR